MQLRVVVGTKCTLGTTRNCAQWHALLSQVTNAERATSALRDLPLELARTWCTPLLQATIFQYLLELELEHELAKQQQLTSAV